MQISEKKEGTDHIPARIVLLDGRFDASAADEVDAFFDGLIEQGEIRIVVDMRKVMYMGSTGIRILLALNAKLKDRGGRSVLFGLPVSGLRIIQAMQIDRFFEIFPDEKTALERVLRES